MISLPNNKSLHLSQFKAFADEKLNVAQNKNLSFIRIENIIGKRRKCWKPEFPIYTQFLKGVFYQRHQKSLFCCKGLYYTTYFQTLTDNKVPIS